MLYTLAVILLIAWLLGIVGTYTIGAFVHVLLVVAIVLFLVGLLSGRPGWSELSAVKSGRVFVADGNAFFNRPGPRLVETAEILQAALSGRRDFHAFPADALRAIQ